MEGSVFLRRFPAGHGDDVTAVDPDGRYDVTGPARHPVAEHHRVRCFASVLGAWSTVGGGGGGGEGEHSRDKDGGGGGGDGGGGGGDGKYTYGGEKKKKRYGATARETEDEQLAVLGELMYQSDAGYERLGLGSDGTGEIVRLVRSLGPRRGLFGAKITGGGSGGTVCVLGRSDGSGEAAVAEVCEAYERATGRKPHMFRGSSPGAVAFNHLRVNVLPP